ncbi:MAG: hypothetical protein CMM61_06835 [Rhodospirillaceae bacterium]|nr:hypothetical protein [Rhodospirillaceae bacterium]
MADGIDLNPVEKLSRAQLKRLTAVHGWSGVILGLVLYVVVFTGAVSVFGSDLNSWSSGGDGSRPLLVDLGGIDNRVREIVEHTPKGYLKRVIIYANPRGEMIIAPYGMAMNEELGEIRPYGTIYHLNPETGERLSRADGFIFDRLENFETSALEHFIVDLHEALYLPDPWGRIVTGIMGLLVMAAGLTGFLMHRHLIRDLFVAARHGERLVTSRDRHVLAASWSLVFAFLLGFTGSFYSFSGPLIRPLVAETAFGGNMEAMRAALFQTKAIPDATPAQVVDLDALVARSTAEIQTPAYFMRVDNWGRADGRISVYHRPPDGDMVRVQNIFRASDGKPFGPKPRIGNAPSLGADLRGLMGPLHFGDFGGVLSKSIWVGLGVAMCYVIVSGLRLWVRRREDDPLWRKYARAVAVTTYGLPLALLICTWFYFPALAAGDPFFWTPVGFFAGCGAAILFGIVTDETRLIGRFRRLLAAGCLGLPVLRLGCGGTGWAESLAQGNPTPMSVDVAFLVIGLGLWLWSHRADGIRNDADGSLATEPAE